MASSIKAVSGMAEKLNLEFKKKLKMSHGFYSGFTVMICQGAYSNENMMNISLCAEVNGAAVSKEWLSEVNFPKHVKFTIKDFMLNLCYKVSGNKNKSVAAAIEALDMLIDNLNKIGAVNCDVYGESDETAVYMCKGVPTILCEKSVADVQSEMQLKSDADKNTKENYPMGILGAFLGSAVGGILVLLIALLNRVSWAAAAIMGFATVYGYKKLGKKFTSVSAVICGVIGVVLNYLVFRVSEAITIFNLLNENGVECTFGECFLYVKDVYALAEAADTYNINMALMVGAGIIGMIVAIGITFSSMKKETEIYKL